MKRLVTDPARVQRRSFAEGEASDGCWRARWPQCSRLYAELASLGSYRGVASYRALDRVDR